MKSHVKFMIVGLSLFILGGLFYLGRSFYLKDRQSETTSWFTNRRELFVPSHAPKIGSGEIYVTEFLDPQCETCREIKPWMKQLLSDYSGKVQWIIRYAPFHPYARFAVELLEATREQNKYWQMLDIFLDKQPEWGGHHNPHPELLWKYLEQAGVDIESVKMKMGDAQILQRINADEEDLKTLKITMTPTLFVNGQRLIELSYQSLSALVDQELARVGN